MQHFCNKIATILQHFCYFFATILLHWFACNIFVAILQRFCCTNLCATFLQQNCNVFVAEKICRFIDSSMIIILLQRAWTHAHIISERTLCLCQRTNSIQFVEVYQIVILLFGFVNYQQVLRYFLQHLTQSVQRNIKIF